MLGFAGGVMIAASFWSLLAPAISISEDLGNPGWLPPLIGFLLGGVSMRLLDSLCRTFIRQWQRLPLKVPLQR